MNLWLRLIFLILKSRGSTRITSTTDVSHVYSRVWPNDLDTSLHMNNGRYLTLMDLGRMDWTFRSGLFKVLWNHKWIPVATTITARFVRELRCWQKFRLDTRIVGWEDSQVFFEQRFLFASGKRRGELAAVALVKAGIYDRKARRMVSIRELFDLTGLEGEKPELREDIVAFLEAEAWMNTVSKRMQDPDDPVT